MSKPTASYNQLPPSGTGEKDKQPQPEPAVPKKRETGSLINDLGHYGGLHAKYRTEDLIMLELKSVETAVNLAKSVNLAQKSEHLIARDILPDKDFRDQNDNAISGRAWRQPWSGVWDNVETDVLTYKINRNVDYHNKVYVFWGLRYVNIGPSHTGAVTDASSITWRDSSNTYDVWQVEALDNHQEMYCFKPVLIKNYTDFNIYLRPKTSGAFDNFQFLGKIIEGAGETIMGRPDPDVR